MGSVSAMPGTASDPPAVGTCLLHGRGQARLAANQPCHMLTCVCCHALKSIRLLPCPDQQVGAPTETELKEKKLRVEDALNATKVGS